MNSLSKSYTLAKKKKSALTLAWICLLFAFVAPILTTIDILIGSTKDYWSLLVITVLWFAMWSVMAYWGYKWATTAKLVISESKIECDDVGTLAGFSTNWENIEYVLVTKTHLALYLKEPSEPITKLGQWVLAHNWVDPKIIDLSSFIEHWQNGELKQDFERCAPYLFNERDEPKPEAA